jgi:hypothetical protein
MSDENYLGMQRRCRQNDCGQNHFVENFSGSSAVNHFGSQFSFLKLAD